MKTISKIPTEYELARDEYGTLTKDQKSKVLDRISEKTNMQVGPEAEKAFVEAVKEIKAESYNEYCYFTGYSP